CCHPVLPHFPTRRSSDLGGELITPSVTDDILEGITRDTVITIAREELGLTVIERAIDRTELFIADEVFFCGTGAQVAPCVNVDRSEEHTSELQSPDHLVC